MKRGLPSALLVLCFVYGTRASAEPDQDRAPPLLVARPDPNTDSDRLGWAVPDYVKLQTGGFLGMFTIGVGYSVFEDRLNLGISYGYVPPLDGAPAVHLGSAMMELRPIWFQFARDRIRYYPLYLGGGVLIAKGKDLFVSQPAVYPPDYYPPTGLHTVLLFGSEVALRVAQPSWFTRHGLYVDVVTIDEYLDSLTENRQFRLYDAFSTALGYRASF